MDLGEEARGGGAGGGGAATAATAGGAGGGGGDGAVGAEPRGGGEPRDGRDALRGGELHRRRLHQLDLRVVPRAGEAAGDGAELHDDCRRRGARDLRRRHARRPRQAAGQAGARALLVAGRGGRRHTHARGPVATPRAAPVRRVHGGRQGAAAAARLEQAQGARQVGQDAREGRAQRGAHGARGRPARLPPLHAQQEGRRAAHPPRAQLDAAQPDRAHRLRVPRPALPRQLADRADVDAVRRARPGDPHHAGRHGQPRLAGVLVHLGAAEYGGRAGRGADLVAVEPSQGAARPGVLLRPEQEDQIDAAAS
mmetsp:Transcript_27261/g.67642  ORF Transcript_27261/g.67642 Transcript_27261/m.67642 type:complete len:310 (+) Transcript_27261:16-945(+)